MGILGLNYVKKSLKNVKEWFSELKKISKFAMYLLLFVLVTIFCYVFDVLFLNHIKAISKSGDNTNKYSVPDLKHRIPFVSIFLYLLFCVLLLIVGIKDSFV